MEKLKRSGASYVQVDSFLHFQLLITFLAKVSSPLFELEVQGNPTASAAINKELKMLLQEGELCREVSDLRKVGGPMGHVTHSWKPNRVLLRT